MSFHVLQLYDACWLELYFPGEGGQSSLKSKRALVELLESRFLRKIPSELEVVSNGFAYVHEFQT